MADKHMSPRELADRLGLPLATIYRMNSEGTGPRYLRVGRHCRFMLRDIIAWENTRYADGNPAA